MRSYLARMKVAVRLIANDMLNEMAPSFTEVAHSLGFEGHGQRKVDVTDTYEPEIRMQWEQEDDEQEYYEILTLCVRENGSIGIIWEQAGRIDVEMWNVSQKKLDTVRPRIERLRKKKAA